MSETTFQDRNERKRIEDIHLAVCGDETLGVPGIVKELAAMKEEQRLTNDHVWKLDRKIEDGMFLGRVGTWTGKLIVGISFVVCAIVAIWECFFKEASK